MNKFVCPFPWLFPCVTTSGNFRVCPVSQSSTTKGMVENRDGHKPHIESLTRMTEVLNSDSLKTLRRKMLAGDDVSETCRRCIVEEKNGLRSRRLIEMRHHPEFNPEFIEHWTQPDGSLREGSPVTLAILRMGNKCNLVCRMCGPSSSSAWYDEWAEMKHPAFQEEGGRIELIANTTESRKTASPNPYAWVENASAMHFVEKCGPSLKTLHFSGGEPLLVRGHIEILRYLVESGRSREISLEYNSNLTVLPEEVLQLWAQFKYLEIGISVDGPPLVNEYIRHPIKTEKLVNNIRRLDAAPINAYYWLSTTVQIYNVLYLEDLETWLQEQKFKRMGPTAWHVLRGPKELSIFALPEPLKQKVARTLTSSSQYGQIATMIFDEDYAAYFSQFVKVTRSMDLYRRQSVQKLTKLWDLVGPEFDQPERKLETC